MIDDTKSFPIQGEGIKLKQSSIPWWLAEIAYGYYSERFGDAQTLERIAERGGFGRDELVKLLRKQS